MMKLFFAFYILSIVSCTNSINVLDLIDKNSPITYTINKNNPLSSKIDLNLISQDTIQIHSKKWYALMDFFSKNSNGWKSTPATYLPVVYLHQDNLSIIVVDQCMVIGFSDADETPKQFIKSINLDELDFLFKE